MKRCAGACGLEKPASEFYRDATKSLGLSSKCKACTLEERARYREANREKLKHQARADRRRVPERGPWQAMNARCYDEANVGYANYGGRGIRVCDRWRGPNGFENFVADMGPRPSPKHTIDRFPDTNGNYEPGNCRWATPEEQGRNKRVNRLLTAFGRTQCLAAWAEEFGLPVGLIKDRIDLLHWPIERALTEPAHALRRGLTAFGETLPVAEWARRNGISFATILNRLDAGWTPELAVREPARKGRPLAGKRKGRAA